MIWSAEGGDNEGVMMADFDLIYAAVSKRQMPSDEKLYSMQT